MDDDGQTLASLIDSGREAERAGAWDEALRHYEAALWRSRREGETAHAANLLRWIGNIHLERGDMELAREVTEASVIIAETAELHKQAAWGLNSRAIEQRLQGDLASAEESHLRALELCEETDDHRLAVMVDQNLGILNGIRGEFGAALSHFDSALGRAWKLGDHLTAVRALINIGITYVDLEEWDEAERCFDVAFLVTDWLDDDNTLSTIELNRAELYLRRGDHDWAREHLDRAFEIETRLESTSGLAETDKLYGIFYRETDKPALARRHFAAAIRRSRESHHQLTEAEAESEWARLCAAREQNRKALERLNSAQTLFEELGARHEVQDLDRRLDELEEVYLLAVRQWGESIEEKDGYTAGHCERVAAYTCMLGEHVGFEDRDLFWLRMGAFLHDVGKTAVPDEVLNKPGLLSDAEWQIMRQHTVTGNEIVSELGFPEQACALVRSHHERWDGSGYPDGLAGEAIALSARILSIADSFDALTTERSYRPALSRQEAMATMERDAGRVLDPGLFRTFRMLLGEEKEDEPAPRTVAAGVPDT